MVWLGAAPTESVLACEGDDHPHVGEQHVQSCDMQSTCLQLDMQSRLELDDY